MHAGCAENGQSSHQCGWVGRPQICWKLFLTHVTRTTWFLKVGTFSARLTKIDPPPKKNHGGVNVAKWPFESPWHKNTQTDSWMITAVTCCPSWAWEISQTCSHLHS